MNDSVYPIIVDVRNLSIDYQSGNETVAAVKQVSLSVASGEVVAIVGESGSGKSTLANALIGLLANNTRETSGTIRIHGQDVTEAIDARGRSLDADVLELPQQMGIDQPVLRARQYPHELSGGMRQRATPHSRPSGRIGSIARHFHADHHP